MNIPVRKPRPPLSAYNLFFQVERKRILNGTDHLDLEISCVDVIIVAAEHKAKSAKRPHRKTHGLIGFKELARLVASRWKKLDREAKKLLESCAKHEKEEFRRQNEAYMTTAEYQMEIQEKIQERPEASTYQDVTLLPKFTFCSTGAWPPEKPIMSSKEVVGPDNRTRSENGNCVRATTRTSEQDVVSGTNNWQWSDNKEQESSKAHTPAVVEYEGQLSQESDLAMMNDMVDFHASVFPEALISDLLDTDYLNFSCQSDFFEA